MYSVNEKHGVFIPGGVVNQPVADSICVRSTNSMNVPFRSTNNHVLVVFKRQEYNLAL